MAMGPDMMGGDPMGSMGMPPASPLPGAPPSMDTPTPPTADAGQSQSKIIRTPPEISESRKAGVAKLVQEIQLDKAHWQSDFDGMRDDMNFARGWQWIDQEGWGDDRYIANIVQRHINQRVSALYAKNPTFICRRKRRLDFQVWDGSMQQLQMAQQAVATMAQMQAAPGAGMAAAAQAPGMMPMAFQAVQQGQAVLQDVQQGLAKRQMYQRLSETLEIVFDYYVGEQSLPFKTQMKQMVRRANTTGIAYVKLGFQRAMEKRPEVVIGLADAAERMAHLQTLVADAADQKIDENSAEMEELRKTMQTLQTEPEVMVREGLVFDYPASWSIIPDRRCKQLKGFIGCDRVTQEYILTPMDVKEIYGIDVSGSYTAYQYANINSTKLQAMGKDTSSSGQSYCCVWEVYEARSATVCTVVEGWPDYLREPLPPEPWLERFWPFFTLSFNDGEHDKKIFPQSDVQLLKPMQREYNRCRDGLRRHRIANRPKTVVAKGVLDEEDEQSLKTHPDNAVIEIGAMQPGQKVEDLLQAWKGSPIDPALYDTNMVFEDVLRVVGAQEANLGGTAGGQTTATESSIAESSRLSSLQSNIDDLDDFLSDLGRAGGQVLLLNLSLETVKQIAGDGAVWPQATKKDVAQELYLEVKAGSSGRPNKAQEMQNMNMILPYLLQMPGINPQWLATETLKRMDDRMDITDALATGMPSITAQNTMAGTPAQPESMTAPRPEGGPAAEGTEGAANAPQPSAGAQGNATPTIPHTRPAVPIPANVAMRAG